MITVSKYTLKRITFNFCITDEISDKNDIQKESYSIDGKLCQVMIKIIIWFITCLDFNETSDRPLLPIPNTNLSQSMIY